MHCFERMLRRAALPFRSSEGFNPKPRLIFPLSLALGIVGCEEAVELELTASLPPEEVHQRLAAQAPPGLDILSVRRIPWKMTGQPRRVCYLVALPPDRRDGLRQRLQELQSVPQWWVDRTRPQPRRLNVRPYLRDLRLLDEHLELDLWVTPQGAARPEEILALLGLSDLLEAGAVLERTKLELCDEAPPDGDSFAGSSVRESMNPSAGTGSGDSATARERAPDPRPLLPGPLSFDS
jgi:radical SAM-linked protein